MSDITNNFSNLSELILALRSYQKSKKRVIDHRFNIVNGQLTLKVPSGQCEVVESEGGYLVSGEIISPILHSLEQKSVLFAGATKFYSSGGKSNTGYLPFVSETARSSTAYQLRTYWINEGEEKQIAKYSYGLASCKLNKLYALMACTEELWEDSGIFRSSLDNFITSKDKGSLIWQVDSQILWGDGTTVFGIMGPSTNGTIGVAVADPIDEATLNAFDDALAPALNETAQWFVSKENYIDIQAINFTNDGDKYYLNGNMYVYGHKVNVMEQMVAPYDIMLGDPSQYAIALKMENGSIFKQATSIHFMFQTDELMLRWGIRVNGKSFGQAYTTNDGTSVGSWVIPNVTPVDMSSSSSSSSYVEGWSSSSSSTEIFSHSSESSPSSYSTQSLSTEITNLSSSSTSSSSSSSS